MSKRSFRLFRRAGKSYLAALTFPDGTTSEIDTKERDEETATRKARFILRQRWAHRRYHQREKLKRQGKPIPAELAKLQPGRRFTTKAEPIAPAGPRKRRAPAEIDVGATVDKLRALAADGLGDEDTPPDAPEIPGAGAPVPSPGDGDGSGAPAAPPIGIPPLPETPPGDNPEPLKPEVLPPGTPSDGELMSEMIATAICAGTIRGVRWMGENSQPPWRPAEPHQGSLEWLQRGLSATIRRRLGDTIISDGTRIVIGFVGVVASMCIGAQPMGQAMPPTGAAATSDDREETTERQAAPEPASPSRHAPPQPAPAPPLSLPATNGIPTAIGRFK